MSRNVDIVISFIEFNTPHFHPLRIMWIIINFRSVFVITIKQKTIIVRNAGWSDIVECSEEETKTFQIGLLTLIWKYCQHEIICIYVAWKFLILHEDKEDEICKKVLFFTCLFVSCMSKEA